MRVLVALIAFVAVAALNLLWWWWPNRPVEIAGWTNAPLQSVSFAPYRPGQSPLTRTFPTPDQIEEDLQPPAGQGPRRPNLFGGREPRNRAAARRQVRAEGLARRLAERQRQGEPRADQPADRPRQQVQGHGRAGDRRQRGAAAQGADGQPAAPLHPPGQAARLAARDLRRRLGILDAQSRRWPTRSTSSPSTSCRTGRTSRSASIAASPTASRRIEKHIVDIYKKVQDALPRQDDRDRRDRLAERRPHALRRAARPGRAGALLLDLPLDRRPREVRLQHRRSLRPVLEGAPGRHGRAPPGACSTRSATTSSSSASRCRPSRTGRSCSPCRRWLAA